MKRNKPNDVFKFIDMKDENECWPWTGATGASAVDPRPYFRVSGQRILAYRLVFELYYGVKLDSQTHIRHTCNNGICCNPKHLMTGTHADNMNDLSKTANAALPAYAVRAIRRLVSEGVTHAEVAERYGVSRSVVTAIVNGRTYKGVEDD